jgi:hypothetical protein
MLVSVVVVAHEFVFGSLSCQKYQNRSASTSSAWNGTSAANRWMPARTSTSAAAGGGRYVQMRNRMLREEMEMSTNWNGNGDNERPQQQQDRDGCFLVMLLFLFAAGTVVAGLVQAIA